MTRARALKNHAHSIRSTGLNNRFNPNTACVLWREMWHDWKIFIFIYDRIDRRRLSIETNVLQVQIIPALNREGVELQFNQSYRFEKTTNSLGKHYIIS
jgi:hypothetical protein